MQVQSTPASGYWQSPPLAILRALAFKWIRILWRCWHDKKPYDEQLYLASQSGRCARAAHLRDQYATQATLDAAG
jgi:hypothetical protein